MFVESMFIGWTKSKSAMVSSSGTLSASSRPDAVGVSPSPSEVEAMVPPVAMMRTRFFTRGFSRLQA